MDRRTFLLALGAATAGSLTHSSRVLAAPKPVIEQGFCLVIDPGHGGENQGCAAHGHEDLREKTVTLALAQQLAGRVVELMPHAQVLLTRERDETLHLSQRVRFANEVGADLFMSLHCNASVRGDQTGFETFLLDAKASSEQAALTAARENDEGYAAPREDEDDVGAMLRELGMANNRKRAALYAKAIQAEQAKRFPKRVDRGVRQANFDVLMGARMPAVLHELGFLDHPEDSQLMLTDAGQAELVESLAQATLGYYSDVVRRG